MSTIGSVALDIQTKVLVNVARVSLLQSSLQIVEAQLAIHVANQKCLAQ